jgi:oligopeptide transport system permease protein
MKGYGPRIWLPTVFLIAISVCALLAGWISPFEADAVGVGEPLLAPDAIHWMGTDALGRDLFSRILEGARLSLAVGVSTAAFSLCIGTVTGMIAGYAGGRIDRLLMSFSDMVLTFPSLLFAILLTLFFGRGFLGIFLAIGLTTWVTQAKMIRGLVLQAKEMPYIEAARAMGASTPRILFRHLLPNLSSPIMVSLTFQVPNNIMTESFLSFIGLGVQPPDTSWGTLASEGFRYIQTYPHLVIFPGLALFLTMLALNVLGDGLIDRTPPRSIS